MFIDWSSQFGQTPLMIATAYGHYGVVNSLTNHELLEINKENVNLYFSRSLLSEVITLIG